ncbi:hypothetical protein NDU88_001861 [Pleurodeles waltl]|uniref:Uncharacterized protein n=1 Tax=Pleurodeles waltl TaxID=8319 RepID=A0AAV7KS05_PLEWA|nr:hypothetical protein NDU88_001861 [Pleurodeles waltl]
MQCCWLPSHKSRNMLDAEIEAVGSDIALLCQDLRKAVEQITEAETRVSGVEDSVGILQEKINKLEAVTKELTLRAEDTEGRARCNNLRFVGFLKGCEGQLVDTFLAKWLCSATNQPDVLPLIRDGQGTLVVDPLELAHRFEMFFRATYARQELLPHASKKK